jgi:beta-lactamase regulating signal transducer with metallopeptidase domain
MNALDVSRMLWDFYLSATGLLAATLLASVFVKQPARRMAVAWAAVAGLFALVVLNLIPNWSYFSLLSPAPPEPAWTAQLEPVFGPAIQRTPRSVAEPSIQHLTPDGEVTTVATQMVVIDWGILASGGLLIGSGVVVVWLLLGAWQVWRLRTRAEAVPQEVTDLLSDLAPQRRVQLGMLAELPVPVALGLRSPCILLPRTLATSASREQLRSVLSHELAHIDHRDLWLLTLLRGLMIVLWPHPLFWLLRRQVRRDQEILADTAAAELSSRTDYAEQLVALARSAVETRVPRLASSVGLWESPSQLTQRIRLLLDEKLTILRNCSRGWRVGSAGALAALALGLSLVTLSPAEEKPASTTDEGVASNNLPEHEQIAAAIDPLRDSEKPNVIVGVCLDEENRPLDGIEVEVFLLKDRSQNPARIADTTTNARGEFELTDVVDVERAFPNGLPEKGNMQPYTPILSLVARQRGRATVWSSHMAYDIARRGKVEMMKLPRAQELKGRIVDESNNPVRGATVWVGAGSRTPGLPADINAATTDENGEFVIKDLASYNIEQAARGPHDPYSQQFAYNVWERFVVVTHPKFARKRIKNFEIPGREDATLSPGATLTGRVVMQEPGEKSKAAAGSVVSLQRYLSQQTIERSEIQLMSTVVDNQGRFRFDSLPSGTYSLNATLAGWVTNGIEKIEVDAAQAETAPNIVMTRGGIVRVQLVDEQTGKPATLQRPARGFILSSPRPLNTARVIDSGTTEVEFSVAGIAERRLPPGEYIILGNMIGSDGQSYWQLKDLAAIRADKRSDTIYEVVEGEVLKIEMQKVGEVQPISHSPQVLRAVDPIAETSELEPKVAPTTTFFTPIAPPAETEALKKADHFFLQPNGEPKREFRNRHRPNAAYEDAVFVPDANADLLRWNQGSKWKLAPLGPEPEFPVPELDE